MQVGGRLQNSCLPFDECHPLIVPSTARLSQLTIEDCHSKVAHQGRGITVAEVKNSGYWIMGLSKMVAKAIHS